MFLTYESKWIWSCEVFLHCSEELTTESLVMMIFKVNEVPIPWIKYSSLEKGCMMDRKLVYANKF